MSRAVSKSKSSHGKVDKFRKKCRGDRSRSSQVNQLRDFQFNEIGVIAHVADETMVYLDIDSRTSPSIRTIFAGCRIVGVRPMWVAYRRTARGWHVIIHLHDRLQPAETIALQSVLGSD